MRFLSQLPDAVCPFQDASLRTRHGVVADCARQVAEEAKSLLQAAREALVRLKQELEKLKLQNADLEDRVSRLVPRWVHIPMLQSRS